MSADDVTPDGYRPNLFQIVDLDHIRRADVGTGCAADAKTLDGDDIIDPVPFFHFKGTGSHNFRANTDAQMTTNTPIRRGPWINVVSRCERDNIFGLGCHSEQVFEGLGSGAFDRLPMGFYHQPFINLEDT